MCSARRLMVFNVCVKFHENVSSGFKVMERTRKIVYTKRAITLKVDEPELRFMCSACRLMVFNVCVKFHENMSSGFKVMERTRKLLKDTHTHTHTHRKDENIIPPWHTSYAGGIKMVGLLPLNVYLFILILLHSERPKLHTILAFTGHKFCKALCLHYQHIVRKQCYPENWTNLHNYHC